MRPGDKPKSWHEEKTYDSIITYGLNAIKFVLLANGGAILAILTFIGSYQNMAEKLNGSIVCFVVGVILGGLVNITAYLTQLSLFNQRNNDVPFYRNHRTWLWLSIIVIFLGTLSFAVGAIWASSALSS
jgi:hypothetical protein